jgi:hypothetical protein
LPSGDERQDRVFSPFGFHVPAGTFAPLQVRFVKTHYKPIEAVRIACGSWRERHAKRLPDLGW